MQSAFSVDHGDVVSKVQPIPPSAGQNFARGAKMTYRGARRLRLKLKRK